MKLKLFKWMPQVKTVNKSLLFLHGMGGTGFIWRPLAAQLEEDYQCFAPDQRGHGESRPIPENESNAFHASDYAADVAELFNTEITTQTWVIGHSMGVRTALALIAKMSENVDCRIKGLIAVDIGISDTWGGGIGLPLAQFLENLPESFPSRTELKSYLIQHCPDASIAQYLSAVAKNSPFSQSLTTENWIFPFDHSALVETIHQANDAKIEANLAKILQAEIKVLFLRGANSKVWLKEDYELQKIKFKHAFLAFEEWENCGHGFPFEQRGRLIEKIRSFTA